ncbi:MAG TPA: hypothetical protein VNI77_09675 [Nitrososphaera sp.]|nr:hypothetical protein [Nitrososphaera sp.]
MNDWIRLAVKFKGKCVECGKEIAPGEYALWSKSSKAIKHIECESSQQRRRGEEGQSEEKPLQHQQVPELDCFICCRPAGCTECGFETDCDRQTVSQACICSQCLEDKHAYANYQRAFIEKARKVKVKI